MLPLSYGVEVDGLTLNALSKYPLNFVQYSEDSPLAAISSEIEYNSTRVKSERFGFGSTFVYVSPLALP